MRSPDSYPARSQPIAPESDERLFFLLEAALKEDIGDGDHSTLCCIPPDARGKAVLKIKQAGIMAGMDIAEKILRHKEPSALFTAFKEDGRPMQAGEKAFEAEAGIHTLLQCERLILNCMQRMSGIATLTRQYVDRLQGYHTRVLDTRKSTPNFRLLEKEAVRIGGGVNHRFGLFDMIMLKDNHIDFCGGIETAIGEAIRYRDESRPELKIEVETRSLDDVRRVLSTGGVDRIMLDNFTPRQVEDALTLIGGRYETEASGGIHLDNIEEYARTGVDFVSIGALIHQAQSLDMSLKALVIPHS
ncbi:MAG: carboxylating nicotinate-nucleotide diphosphorylase [Bacteroidota bacterium]|nr:carboxylating nicotinate-nucleotide diphosphorylase [Bacteroidota bacterium]